MNQTTATKKNKLATDRRVFVRFSLQIPIRFLEIGREKEREGQVLNISANGIGFISNTRLPNNTPLKIWIEVPGRSEPLHLLGKVIWSKKSTIKKDKPWRAGAQLENANLVGLSQILQYNMKKCRSQCKF